MKTRRWLVIIIVALMVLAFGWLLVILKSGSNVERYKAALRARGEKISFDELGYPLAPESGTNLSQFTNAVKRIKAGKYAPGSLYLMESTSPGHARVLARGDKVQLGQTGSYSARTNQTMSWPEFNDELLRVGQDLEDIRTTLQSPFRCYVFNPTNVPFSRIPIFVQMRQAAQWLSADAVGALHARDRARARSDLHALANLVDWNKEDPTLVSHMIRVAIGGLQVATTWEALQAPGWTEEELAELQKDFERADFLDAIERGMTTERASMEQIIIYIHRDGAAWVSRSFGISKPPTNLKDKFTELGGAMLWRLTADDNELVMLQHDQGMLDEIRKLRTGATTWPASDAVLKASLAGFNAKFNGLGRFRYTIAAVAIPNFSKALSVSVQRETERRLTVTAIALRRYESRHGKPAESLKALVPEFLSAVPMDPMNAKPLGYVLKPELG
ncbi:MAG: hypothetical protein EPO07_07815, partial [Verrucomicrobia bacterium]